MAKVPFSKLGLKINTQVKTVVYNNQNIEVKQYLPVEEKLNLIADVLNLSADDNNFANPEKIDVYFNIAILDYYTNISFTEKQKENITKLYDSILSTGFIALINESIPEEEYMDILKGLQKTIKAVYSYKNSVLGILDTIGQDYSNLNLDASAIQKKLADPNSLGLLQDILTKLG